MGGETQSCSNKKYSPGSKKTENKNQLVTIHYMRRITGILPHMICNVYGWRDGCFCNWLYSVRLLCKQACSQQTLLGVCVCVCLAGIDMEWHNTHSPKARHLTLDNGNICSERYAQRPVPPHPTYRPWCIVLYFYLVKQKGNTTPASHPDWRFYSNNKKK